MLSIIGLVNSLLFKSYKSFDDAFYIVYNLLSGLLNNGGVFTSHFPSYFYERTVVTRGVSYKHWTCQIFFYF